MKSFKVLCLSLMFFSLTLFAQESTEQSQANIEIPKPRTDNRKVTVLKTETADPIKSLLAQIKDAKVDNRRLLINQLKVQLRQMNKKSRQKAMMALKESFASKGNDQHKQQQNLQEEQSKHQPKYRQLRNGQGQGANRGNGNGQGNGQQ